MNNWQLFMNNVYTCQPSKAQMACTYLKAKSGICIKVWINSNKYFIVHYLLATCGGVFIKNLEEEEDWHLLNESDSDASDFMYHEKMQPDVLQEVWDITEEVVNEDFPQDQSKLPSVDVFETSRVSRSAKVIVRWMLIFLCLWSSFCSLSDNAFELLLVFLRAVFDSTRTASISGKFCCLVSKVSDDQDKFMKYVVCSKCNSLHNFDDCYETLHRRKVTKTCSFIQFLHHRQHFHRTACGQPLLKEVSLKSGQTKLYCCNSVTEN
mgnify:CR=1 FL=1